MATYLVTYDLTGQRQNYAAIETALKAHGTTTRMLLSTWLLESPDEPGEIINALMLTDYDKDDRWLVVTASGPWAKRNLRDEAVEIFIEKQLGDAQYKDVV